MDERLKHKIIKNAQQLWKEGQSLDAGQMVFEHIPRQHRSKWASGILRLTYRLFTSSPDIDAILEFAGAPEKWGKGKESRWQEAHSLVDAVNRFPYIEPIPPAQVIFRLATNVGKVVYNAQGYPAPFDHDAGWEIAENLKQIVNQAADDGFEEEALLALCAEKFIESDEPVMCHPACPVCGAAAVEWKQAQGKT